MSKLGTTPSVGRTAALHLTFATGLASMLLCGCTDDAGSDENVFPTDGSTAAATGMSSTTVAPTTTTSDSATSTTAAPTGDATDDTTVDVAPRSYRFDCIDIQGVGNADAMSFQAQILENTWAADIAATKINILFNVIEEDLAGGIGSIGIRSGVGLDPNNLCSDPSSETPLVDVELIDGEERWIPTTASGECSAPGAGSGGRTYVLTLAGDDLVYIYSEDDNTVEFNCTPDQAVPDAVPLRAVVAEVSVDPTLQTVSGSLIGCLTLSEGQQLCSCLASCAAKGPGDLQTTGECAGCPKGGVPLTTLLGDVGASDRCTGLTGEPAYDLVIGFTAQRLDVVPPTCG